MKHPEQGVTSFVICGSASLFLGNDHVSRGAQLNFLEGIRQIALTHGGNIWRADRATRLEQSRAGLVDRRLRRSVEFMHNNFARDLQLGEIAAAAYLSEFHFARLFKRITGVTPHAYLASLRVEHARRLLVATDLSVAEVGERVGYQSASHFGKVFRQATGVTPTAFRESVVR